jgi:hypothetical protein
LIRSKRNANRALRSQGHPKAPQTVMRSPFRPE